MFWLGLLACNGASAPEVPARPTLGVAVPLSGPDAELGAAALDGVALAAGPGFDVLAVDDTRPGAVATLAANPLVFGVVAHVVRGTANATAAAWRASDLPVVIAAPGTFEGLPRVVPPIEESARCAGLFIDTNFAVRTDGSPAGMAAGVSLLDAVPEHAVGLDTVDSAHVAGQAAKLRGRTRYVAWTGDAAAGGNFLRALRQVGEDAPFLGVGLYDLRFLEAAGAAAEGARVTSEGRPARSRAFVDAFTAAEGSGPPGAAVDAYEAATLLVAAYRSTGTPTPERAAVREALRTVQAEGANGPMSLGTDGVLRPIVCATFLVKDGAFVVERIASEADAPPE